MIWLRERCINLFELIGVHDIMDGKPHWLMNKLSRVPILSYSVFPYCHVPIFHTHVPYTHIPMLIPYSHTIMFPYSILHTPYSHTIMFPYSILHTPYSILHTPYFHRTIFLHSVVQVGTGICVWYCTLLLFCSVRLWQRTLEAQDRLLRLISSLHTAITKSIYCT